MISNWWCTPNGCSEKRNYDLYSPCESDTLAPKLYCMKENGLKYGIFGAVTVVIYVLALYYVDKKLLTNAVATYWLPLLLIFPPLMYKAALDEVEAHGKKDFRTFLRTPFLTFAVANVAFWLCLYALHMADPDLARMELTQQLEYAQGQLKQGMGDPQQMNKIREQVSQIQMELQAIQQPVGPYIFSMAIWKILGFGLAAAVTGLVRSR